MPKTFTKMEKQELISNYLSNYGFLFIEKETHINKTLVSLILESKNARFISILPFLITKFSVNPKDHLYFDLKTINKKILEKIYSVWELLNIETPFLYEARKLGIKKIKLTEQEKNSYINLYDLYSRNENSITVVKENSKLELAFQYHLSILFSPKQKEIILKKLNNEKLSKTEKEYFSRIIRKKLSAISNKRIYELARLLIT